MWLNNNKKYIYSSVILPSAHFTVRGVAISSGTKGMKSNMQFLSFPPLGQMQHCLWMWIPLLRSSCSGCMDVCWGMHNMNMQKISNFPFSSLQDHSIPRKHFLSFLCIARKTSQNNLSAISDCNMGFFFKKEKKSRHLIKWGYIRSNLSIHDCTIHAPVPVSSIMVHQCAE